MIGALAIAVGVLAVLDDDNSEIDLEELFQRAVAFENPQILMDRLDEQQQKRLYFVLNERINGSKDKEEKEIRLKQALLFMKEVQGVIRTDNLHYRATFNTIPYLQQASIEDLRKLSECDFRSDYAADDVAWWMRERDSDVASVIYEIESEQLGFEVYIDKEPAKYWLDAARPGWDIE